MNKLYSQLRKKGVPSYALPRLVRLIEMYVGPLYGIASLIANTQCSFYFRVATNATFKQAKGDLVKKGWDPRADAKGDKLYWLNGTKYEKLDTESWSSIENGQAKL